MATIPIRDVPGEAVEPSGNELILIDNGITMQKATINDAVTPKASEIADQKIADLNLGTAAQANVEDFATAAQGELADTAVQPARTITAGDGLTGGGDLSADRTISLNGASIASLALADTAIQSVVAGANVTVDATDPRNPIISASGGGGAASTDFATVADLLADDNDKIGYAGSGADTEVLPGEIITAQGFRYEVAASDAVDAHVETAGGVKLYVLPGSSGYDVAAFGADATGSTDSAAAIQKALDLGEVHFPEGQFRVGTKLIYKSYTKITGSGREKTKIISDVIGDSLFAPDDNVSFFSMDDLSLIGNNLTGSLGNGHALNLMDAIPGADESSWSPQHVSVRRVYIRGFRGEDIYATGATDKISACGVAIHSGTVMNFEEVLVNSCGHGYWLYAQEHVRFYNCTAISCDKMGVVSAFCEDIVWIGGHVLACADGTPDPDYPQSDFGSCGILDYHNRNFVFRDGRMKEFGGTSAVRSINSYGSIYEGNDIRADGAGTSSTPNKGIYAIRPRGLSIKKNWFHGVVNSGDKFEYIDISVPTLQPSVFAIEDNVFDNTSTGIAYSVRVKGEGAGNARAICRITGNIFGAEATTLPSAVDADIVFDTVRLVASEVYGNSHVAPNNATKTACVVATTFNNTGSKIGPSDFLATSGTIIDRYVGIREDVITATTIYDPPSITAENDIAETFSVPGARMGDIVSVSSPSDHSGVHLSGFVSSANNVTVVLKNYTTSDVDLGSITLNIRCETFKQMSI